MATEHGYEAININTVFTVSGVICNFVNRWADAPTHSSWITLKYKYRDVRSREFRAHYFHPAFQFSAVGKTTLIKALTILERNAQGELFLRKSIHSILSLTKYSNQNITLKLQGIDSLIVFNSITKRGPTKKKVPNVYNKTSTSQIVTFGFSCFFP